MSDTNHARAPVRFGPYEVCSDSGELRKHGVRLRLSGQAIELLLTLLETPGRVVLREELQQKLWPGASFGDFDHGLNAAVNRLREVLGDSATLPKFIETVPRRGYRFVGQIEPEQSADGADVIAPQVEGSSKPGRVRTVGISAAAVLVAIVGGSIYLSREPARTEPPVTVIPFTTYAGSEAAPSFSPDGSQIVFEWFRDFRPAAFADLYVKQVGNERAVRLTNYDARFIIPAWSPDGKHIAFTMTGKRGNGVYVIPSLGGPERLLARIADSYWPFLLLSWSPDSRLLAFTSNMSTAGVSVTPGHYRIHVIDVASGEEQILSDPSPDCLITMEPAFSPDGKYLASACVLGESVNKIYVQRAAGREAREVALVANTRALQGLAWTPDGQAIVYSAASGLWRAAITGGTPERLTFAHDAITPAVARTGNTLAYGQVSMHRDIWRFDLSAPTSVAGSPVKLISSSLGQQEPSFSPDGERIAFTSGRSGSSEIWVCHRDGSNPIQLSSLGGPEAGSPRWSPDGQRIVFNSTGRGELYIVKADGGRVQRLDAPLTARRPLWSKDGQWIYFATWTPQAVWRIPVAGGAAVRVTGEGPDNPQLSPDGERLYYTVGGELGHSEQAELWSMPVNGGDARREPGMPPLKLGAAWTTTRNGIYFIDGSEPPFAMCYLEFATRHLYKVSDLPLSFVLGGIAVSPDNGTLLFTGIDHGESDIVLAENFR
jgi:Tol biopolymer transport system component/DNA-binding winged helix-turn-helix (wHTH) protein